MSIRSLAARGLSFAHLASITPRGARAEDDDRDDDDRAEDDEQEERDREDGGGNGSKGKKGKRAEDRDDDKDAEDDKDEVEDDDSGKGKKGQRAEDDDSDEDDDDSDPDAEDDDGEMRGKSAAARARRREQARCAAIMASKAAARNPVLAANLAFKTRMTRTEAIATLEATPAPASSAQSRRADRNPNLGAYGGTKPSRQQAIADRWDANLKAANPSRR